MSFAYNAGLWNFMLKPTKDDTQAAMGELKAEFFSALGTEHPELYRQLVAALERRQKGAQRG